MQAILCEGVGGPEVLRFEKISVPQASPTELLVRVRAIGLNRADLLQARGVYQAPAESSSLLGLELAGEVMGMGAEVKDFLIGDRVFGLVSGGAYAEFCVLDQSLAIKTPPSWTDEYAAAIPEAFFTADEALFTVGQLEKGHSILVHAVGSGVGTVALQMARSIGAEVIASAGHERKLEWARTHGAKAVINYRNEDLEARVLQETEGHGVHRILDVIGAKYLGLHLQCLAPKGRLIVLGLMGGKSAEMNLEMLMRKRLSVMGTVIRSQTLAEKAAMAQRFQTHWLPKILDKSIEPICDRVFPWQDVQEAHQYLHANENLGKVVLRVGRRV